MSEEVSEEERAKELISSTKNAIHEADFTDNCLKGVCDGWKAKAFYRTKTQRNGEHQLHLGIKLDAPFSLEGLKVNTSWAVATTPRGMKARDTVELFRGYCGWKVGTSKTDPNACVSVSALGMMSLFDFHEDEFGEKITSRLTKGLWVPKAGFMKGKSIGLSGYRLYTQDEYQSWRPGQEYNIFIDY